MKEGFRTEQPASVEQEKKCAYEILAEPETRERLKERMLRFVKAVHDRKVDSLVFLDRSARPLSWMFQDLWKGIYPNEERLEIKFVNIGTSSHVHKGVSHLLRSIYWGSYERGTSGSTETKLRPQIKETERNDRWFSSSEIPPEWQTSIIEHLDVSNELQSIFKKSFEDKSVLVVDEMGASGKSQMAALGFFTMAFPGAKKFESTSLFYARYSDAGNVSDKECIPWLQELGMSGVVELPEGILSGAITKKNIQKIVPRLQKEIEKAKSIINDFGDDEEEQKLLDRRLEWKRLYEHPEELIARARQLRQELKQLASDALADQEK